MVNERDVADTAYEVETRDQRGESAKLSLDNGAQAIATQESITTSNTSHGRNWGEIFNDFASRMVFSLAAVADTVDRNLKNLADRGFNLLPLKVKNFAIEINESFKAARNRTIGLERSPGAAEVNAQRGDVPGWVLVVLMTTGLVTALWAIAAPRLSAILKNSLDSMNTIR